MAKIEVSKLTGAALDWAVAKADGKTPKINCTSFRGAFICRVYLGWSYAYSSNGSIVEYCPSTDWAQGGPIIEREGVTITQYDDYPNWSATLYATDYNEHKAATGPTPLIAAMRCYVASKLGGEVEIPQELT